MSMRNVFAGFIMSAALALSVQPIMAQANQNGSRVIATTQNGDYPGFDLRTVKDVSLEQCENICLKDQECRAFTYNVKAKWCFLKSDYGQMNTIEGAVAGKVLDPAAVEVELAAPTPLTFVPASMLDEARAYRNKLNTAEKPAGEVAKLLRAAQRNYEAGNTSSAVIDFARIVPIAKENSAVWMGLSRSTLVESQSEGASWDVRRAAANSAILAYQFSRTVSERAEALSNLAKALEMRDSFRPALDAYKASLALQNSAAINAAYEDLRVRKGFRVVDHTIDSDSANPRVCIQLSEPLMKSGIDYASFVTIDDATPKGVEAKDKQICIEGLQHGKNYRIGVRSGLPAAIGEMIEAPVALNIYVRDRAPTVRFNGDAFVLPSTMRRGIPVVSINVKTIDLEVYRVGERALTQSMDGISFFGQLDGYATSQIVSTLGEKVYTGKLDVESDLNKEIVSSFPVDEALPKRKPGIYIMTAKAEGDKSEFWSSQATQWFLVSDTGLATFAGEDGLNVFARSLATAKPLSGVELQLLAANNEVLGTATTDSDGRATFTAGLMRGTAAMAPAILTARSKGNGDEEDYVFLDMKRAGFDLSDRGVTGRPAPGALDVYGWTERGIYRTGETVHAAALVRDSAAKAVENLPLTFSFLRPDGVEDRAIVSTSQAAGGHAVDLPLADNAMRGTWTLRILSDPKATPLSEKQFLVEDFVPDRTEFDLTSDVKEIRAGDAAVVKVDGRHLYGAPAAGLTLEGEVNIRPTRSWDMFPKYVFGLADEEQPEDTRTTLDALPVLNEQGKAEIPVVLNDLPATTQRLNADIVVRMREGGGRAVERKLTLPVASDTNMIGIKPEFDSDNLGENSNAQFSVIVSDANGKRVIEDGLEWSLVKVERNYQWYRSGSSWNYEPVTYTKKVADGTVSVDEQTAGSIQVPVEWGRYRLEVATSDPDGPQTSVEFYAGWYVEARSTETPDGLEVALDKETYKDGETAILKVSPRFAGELLVTIGADSLLMTKTVSVPAEGAEVEIPVSGEWGAGAYITASLYRPGEAQESRMPARAIGIRWLAVDPAERKLSVRIETPEKTEPRQALTIPVSIGGLKSGDQAYVMISAVDVGILNLTNHKPADPAGWYFGQRQLGLEIRDLYGRLIDGSLGTMGRLRTGGDGAQMAVEGSPPTEKLVAFFAGPVEVGADGKASVNFEIPQFNGTARVSAVAWTKTAVGNAQSDVIIRDPVVVTAALPKFMAPQDQAQLRLDIANTDGPAGQYSVSVASSGLVSVPQAQAPSSVTLGQGEKTHLILPLQAERAGTEVLTVQLTHESGLSISQDLILPVRASSLPETTRKEVTLAAVNGSLVINKELFAGQRMDGASVSINVSNASGFDIPGLLTSLDRYPYGCTEQTASRALPLLYMNELAKQAGMPLQDSDEELNKRIQDAIYKVLNNQSSSGSFGLWSPDSGDLWLDAYVTDFLTRAREQKFDVPQQAMVLALDNLQNALSYDVSIKDNGNSIAYAFYVLSRNRRASIADLRYYVDTRLEEFASPLARAQVGASLALYGDGERSEKAFVSAFRLADKGNISWARSDYGSNLRDGAAILALAAESRPVPSIVPELVKMVGGLSNETRYTSTQEQAWLLLAARGLKDEDANLTLQLNGEDRQGALSERMTGEQLEVAPVTIANTGAKPVTAVITTVAAPVEAPPAGGDGFTIARSYYALDGLEVSVSDAQQNERYVVVLKVTETNNWASRILITDLLPAGFEIDNPRIVDSADLSNFGWLDGTTVAHSEFRSDRFVAAFNSSGGDAREYTVAYTVRAVTPGTYAHPAPYVEDMYRPQYFGRGAAGMMQVQPAQ
ncbi:alpha-2-macroglobulin family protein [Pseudochrobactrum kiredjianiae]|uniref:Alpha-2-macroglobulin family protein n=1 Tax=Pseudochrobactrum kiredjianiae TaxID=386305 RepID=A0ABW3V1L5_9HYPH|nr:alpha-2-macroglobulin family protein [Pseudochrobactrum kiredjianiae]MDM7852130.1 alpha-2-macroglobulin family protein [Pseudochrobactrum kiredjianiae]